MFFRRIHASVLHFPSLSGGSVRCSSGDRLKAAEPRSLATLPLNNPRQPAVISVHILGADRCSLCRKAAFFVRRIVVAFSPPLSLQDSKAELSHTGSPSLLQGGVALQGEVCKFGAGLYRQERETLGLLSAAERRHLDSSSQFSDSALGPRATDELQRTRVFEVLVEVRELNLDQAPFVCHVLGLKEAQLQALRKEIPVVYVNGLKVCTLKVDGPAVRAALVKELRRWSVEPIGYCS